MALPIDSSSEVGHAFDAKFAYLMFVADRVGVQNYGGCRDDGETMDPPMVLRAHDVVRNATDPANADQTAGQTAPANLGWVLAYAG